MIGFIIGLFVGGFLGVCVMCLCNAASRADNSIEQMNINTVTAEVSFEDGSSDTATLRFSCINADQQNGIIIGARIDSLK